MLCDGIHDKLCWMIGKFGGRFVFVCPLSLFAVRMFVSTGVGHTLVRTRPRACRQAVFLAR